MKNPAITPFYKQRPKLERYQFPIGSSTVNNFDVISKFQGAKRPSL